MNDFIPLARRPGESANEWGTRLVDELTRSHRRAARVPLERYLQALPGLAAEPELFGDLLVAEWALRRQAGESFTLDEYRVRFPDSAEEVALLWEADRQVQGDGMAFSSGDAAWPAWYVGPATFPFDFAGYRLLRELGGGGMARVFVAEKAGNPEAVVVKVPKFPVEQDDEAVHRRKSIRERFLREARHVRGIDHPNLCRALDVGEEQGLPFFAMPYYPLGSIADELRDRGPFAPADAARLVADVCRGLHHAHGRGLIHRDVKPSNLLRGTSGEVVVADFGLVLALEGEEPRLTSTGRTVGTATYLSPEQALGQGLTPASDQFSLGAVLYELLSGRLAFPGKSFLEVLLAVEAAAPVPLEEVCPGVPPGLAAICRRAMARNPADRYPSLAVLAEDLDRFVAGTWAPPATPSDLADTVPIRNRSRAGKRRWLAAACVAGVGLLVGALLARGRWGNNDSPWVDGGGATSSTARAIVSTRTPIGYRRQLQQMRDDLDQLSAVVRAHVRYFSLMAVHDNPYVSDVDLDAHLPALKRLLNRFSHDKARVPIYPVDAGGSLLRIDLRDLAWHPEVEWQTLLGVEPYGVRYDGANNPDGAVRKLAHDAYGLAGMNSLFDAPVIRGDWFIATASRPSLFDALQQLEGKDRRTPPFDLAAKDDPVGRVVDLYRTGRVDARVAAAELGLETPAALDARWRGQNASLREALGTSVSRGEWAGEGGRCLFAEAVRVLKLGVPRATQSLR